MTLFRQLMMTIVAIFSMMLVVVMAINFNTTKGYLIGQLESTTQDSATSLSMSVSDFMALEDYASVQSSINAVFDSGYFSQVRIHIYESDQSIVRSNETRIDGVPAWFIQLIDFKVPVAKAVISNGWSELGQVYITGSAGYGYYQLWLASRDLLVSFFLIGAITLVLGSVALRYLFRPLAELEKQAEAIQQRRFIKMIDVPKTRELKSVVLSMNRMAKKLEKEFASEVETAKWLQAKAFKDPVSGLGNRHFFESQMKSHFTEMERGTDGLVLISLMDLAKLNNERGYESADMFIQSAADILAKKVAAISSSATLARLSGADFVVLIPTVDFNQLEQVVKAMMLDLMELNTASISYSVGVANMGAVTIDASVERSSAMSQADAALREAKREGANTYRVFDLKTAQDMAISRTAWKDILEQAIQTRSFYLKKQPVATLGDASSVLHEEVFMGLVHEGKAYHAGYFIGLAEQFDLGSEIDQVIIEHVIDFIKTRHLVVPLTVNLSASSYAKASFIAWLNTRLSHLGGDVKSKLMFEISEQSVLIEEQQANALAQMLKAQGVPFGIDNVGKQFSAFQYLQTLMPDYVKVASSYTRMAAGKESESFFMHTLCKMFNSLNIEVIATGVENERQLVALQRFDIIGAQGFLVGRAQDM
ncbi:EAL domain-containing protein [Marinomonas sp. M1K-6]|uniref:EAL domain-containing protein n=1 Tax=Marinomonas profundi TaxID=2726122 RepID=A0A847R2M3_9GAMM|nr:EAL domain-containing protein [Marinomonas profundi]NLQ16116.1 EAL domain-containing protein [Marinomonas profundi]UDV03298.1 EAL domain-containing protein [Marinomonas profundi]